jgi:hypothetical protein
MKYRYLALIGILPLLWSCAAPSASTGSSAGAQMGAHGRREFKIVRLKPGQVASDMLDHAMALVVTADSKIEGGKQVITLSASSHLDGPDGRLEAVKNIGIHMTQPADFKTPPNPSPSAETHATQSVAAAGGKYKTVVAEAFMSSDKFLDTRVTVTVPGDQ